MIFHQLDDLFWSLILFDEFVINKLNLVLFNFDEVDIFYFVKNIFEKGSVSFSICD